MCEFFAIIGGNPNKLLARAEGIVRSMSFRQPDGIGLMAIDKQGGWAIRRALEARATPTLIGTGPRAPDLPFIVKPKSNLLPPNEDVWALVWHTRFGTTGSKSIEDVHPFQGRRYLLAHNGILDQMPKRWCRTEKGGFDDHDSRALLRAVEKGGFNAWRSFMGYGAIFTYDTKEKQLHIHHDDRSRLYAGTWEDSVVFATNPPTTFGIEMFEVEDNVHVTVNAGKDVLGCSVENWKGFREGLPYNSMVQKALGTAEHKNPSTSNGYNPGVTTLPTPGAAVSQDASGNKMITHQKNYMSPSQQKLYDDVVKGYEDDGDDDAGWPGHYCG